MVRKTTRRSHMRKTKNGKVVPVRKHKMRIPQKSLVQKPTKNEKKLLEKTLKNELKEEHKLHEKFTEKYKGKKLNDISQKDINKIKNDYNINQVTLQDGKFWLVRRNNFDFAYFKNKSDAMKWRDWRVNNLLRDITGKKLKNEPKDLEEKHVTYLEREKFNKDFSKISKLAGGSALSLFYGVRLLSLFPAVSTALFGLTSLGVLGTIAGVKLAKKRLV